MLGRLYHYDMKKENLTTAVNKRVEEFRKLYGYDPELLMVNRNEELLVDELSIELNVKISSIQPSHFMLLPFIDRRLPIIVCDRSPVL